MSRKCKGSWIDTYLDYTQNQESPVAFNEWVGLMLLSAAVGRHAWIPRIGYTIYPNLFVILVAGSAVCRKSVAINIGMGILRALEKPPMVFAQKITTEALIQALEQAKVEGSSSGLVCASELATFIGAEGIKSGIIPALTDLYDSPTEWTYHTRGRGKEVLRNVTLSVIAASTKDWLRSSIPVTAIGGGFTSRIIFVFQVERAKLMLFPEDGVEVEGLRPLLINDLNDIRKNVKGTLVFTPDARIVAREWYERQKGVSVDPKMDGYFARKHDTMFKIASLLSISEGNNRSIDSTHIKRALNMLAENEVNLGAILASVVASAVGGETEKVFDMIRREGKILHTELLRKCWRTVKAVELNEIVKTLIDSGEIEEIVATDNRSRWYKVRKGR